MLETTLSDRDIKPLAFSPKNNLTYIGTAWFMDNYKSLNLGHLRVINHNHNLSFKAAKIKRKKLVQQRDKLIKLLNLVNKKDMTKKGIDK